MRRNNKDIEADILRIATGGARKTQIVYRGNLNFKIVKGYLNRLIERGCIDHDRKGMLFHTTQRGFEFLRRYDLLQSMDEQQPPLLAV